MDVSAQDVSHYNTYQTKTFRSGFFQEAACLIESVFDVEGGTTTDCKNRVRPAWNKWREVTGVICDKKVPVKIKHKIYKTVIRPTMTYGAECWTMKKKDEMLI